MRKQALLDRMYSVYSNRNPFFSEGWGKKDILNHLIYEGTEKVNQKLQKRKLKNIKIQWSEEYMQDEIVIQEGTFQSPFEYTWKWNKSSYKEKLPTEVETAHIQFIIPRVKFKNMPIVIHFAATGDEGFSRRRRMLGIPLAKIGIASVILENPFYGRRRLLSQKNKPIEYFTDFLKMNRATQDEGLALLKYFRNEGYTNLGVTGISMGAYIALAVAQQFPYTLAVSACLPSHCASAAYTEGVMMKSCDWKKLKEDLKPEQDPIEYMRKILDVSDLRKLPTPKRTNHAILIGAKKDAYIPEYSTYYIHKHWEGSELRWVNSGHVGSILFHIKDYRKSIIDSFNQIMN